MRSRISSSPAVAVAMKATERPLLAANCSAKALFPLRAPPRITMSRGVTLCSESAMWLLLTREHSFYSRSYHHQYQQCHNLHHFFNGSIAITRQPSNAPGYPEAKHQCRSARRRPYDETDPLPCDQDYRQ